MELFVSFLYQVLFTFGVIVLFGSLIAFCRRSFCRLVGRGGPVVLLVTGAVGTPIHELSHALMCLVFGHKIRAIKLYRPNSSDGTLGYVTHSYNSKNIYHQIGNYFIGIAPILGGSGVLMLLMLFMVPQIWGAVTYSLSGISGILAGGANISALGDFIGIAWQVFLSVFDFSQAGNVWWWVFIVLALMISSHMELSRADIKGGIKGLLILLGILLVVDAALYFIWLPALVAVTSAMTVAGLALTSFLLISGIFSLILLLIALIIKGISLIFKR